MFVVCCSREPQPSPRLESGDDDIVHVPSACDFSDDVFGFGLDSCGVEGSGGMYARASVDGSSASSSSTASSPPSTAAHAAAVSFVTSALASTSLSGSIDGSAAAAAAANDDDSSDSDSDSNDSSDESESDSDSSDDDDDDDEEEEDDAFSTLPLPPAAARSHLSDAGFIPPHQLVKRGEFSLGISDQLHVKPRNV